MTCIGNTEIENRAWFGRNLIVIMNINALKFLYCSFANLIVGGFLSAKFWIFPNPEKYSFKDDWLFDIFIRCRTTSILLN